MRLAQLGFVVCGSLVIGACATSFPAPLELMDARASLARASAGPAGQINKPGLLVAKKALAQAEEALDKAWDYEVAAKSYVAMRKAELAEVQAAKIMAIQHLNAAEKANADLDARAAPGSGAPPVR